MKKTIATIAAVFMATTATAERATALHDCYIDAMLDWQGIDRGVYEAVVASGSGEAYLAARKMQRATTEAVAMATSAMDQGYSVSIIAQAMQDAFPSDTVADMTICNMAYVR